MEEITNVKHDILTTNPKSQQKSSNLFFSEFNRNEHDNLIKRLEYCYKDETYNDMDFLNDMNGRRNPEEEYFRLCCLALKISYIENDSEFYFSVPPEKLFQRCKLQKVPFHRWYTWIEKELLKIN